MKTTEDTSYGTPYTVSSRLAEYLDLLMADRPSDVDERDYTFHVAVALSLNLAALARLWDIHPTLIMSIVASALREVEKTDVGGESDTLH